MISSMDMMDRQEGKSDKGYRGYSTVKMRWDEKQGGQQGDDGCVMVQRMRGRDVVRTRRAVQSPSRRRPSVGRIITTLRAGDALHTCRLLDT